MKIMNIECADVAVYMEPCQIGQNVDNLIHEYTLQRTAKLLAVGSALRN